MNTRVWFIANDNVKTSNALSIKTTPVHVQPTAHGRPTDDKAEHNQAKSTLKPEGKLATVQKKTHPKQHTRYLTLFTLQPEI